MERLLRDYLLVMTTSNGNDGDKSSSVHWAIVASVCIDYCTTVKRVDLLFSIVYDAFVSVDATRSFLMSLEPYIRNGKLETLTPIIMKGFVEAHTTSGALGRVERSLLFLDLR